MSLYTMPCVIFAGGKSSRTGENKAFLSFGGFDSLIEYQVQRLKKIFTNVYISAKKTEAFKGLNTVIIEDLLYSEVYAPTTGFYNIFKHLDKEDYFFILSVDTPFVNEELINEFLKIKDKQYDAIIAKTPSGIHPLCGIYTRTLLEPIKEMLENDNHKLMYLLKNSNVYYLEVKEEECLLNLNTPDEYQQALRLIDA